MFLGLWLLAGRLGKVSFAVFLYLLLSAAPLTALIKNSRAMLRPDWLCLVLALLMAGSSFLSFIYSSHILGAMALKAAAAAVLLALWYLFFRSLRVIRWRDLIGRDDGRHLRPGELILLAAVLSALIIIRYLHYFPYGQTQDCVNQWQQIHGQLPYNTVHAIGHTLFLKCLLSIYDSYTVVVIFQLICLLALLLAYGDFFRKKGLPLWLITLLSGLGLLCGQEATAAFFFPYKDGPAALCTGLAVLMMMRCVDRDTVGRPEAVALGAALAGCLIFRLNGIIALAVCAVYMAVVLIKKRMLSRLALLLSAMLVCLIGVNFILAPAVLKPVSYPNGFSVQVFGSGICAMVDSGELSADELEQVQSILPLDWIEENYDIHNKKPLLWNSDGFENERDEAGIEILNNRFVLQMGENRKDVILLYLRLLPGHIGAAARDIMYNLSMFWKVDGLAATDSYPFLFAMLLLLTVDCGLRRGELSVFLPTLCNSLSIMVSTVTNEQRYILPSFMLAPALALYAIWRAKEKEKLSSSALSK